MDEIGPQGAVSDGLFPEIDKWESTNGQIQVNLSYLDRCVNPGKFSIVNNSFHMIPIQITHQVNAHVRT